LEVTVNAKQVIALIWTLIAVVLSLIIVLGTGFPNWMGLGPLPWWMVLAAFFGVLLVITLPVYLLLVVWALVAKPESE
jgi:hypothetical protein